MVESALTKTSPLVNPPFTKAGYIQVYTGEGKGKTMAALGLALRALGKGWNVLLISLSRDGEADSLLSSIRKLLSPEAARLLTVVQTGAQGNGASRVMFTQAVRKEEALEISNGWQIAKRAALSGKYHLMVMDEANMAIDLQLIPLEEMKALLATKPAELEVVLTGRRAHPDLIAMADLVSEIQPVKHC